MKKLLAIVVLGLLWSGNVYAANFEAHVKNYFDTSKSYYGFSKKDFKEAKKQAFDDCKASSVEKQIDSSGCLLYALQSSSALRALTNKEYEEVFWDREVAKFEKSLQPKTSALTQDQAISKYLKDKKLDSIEGIWVYQPGGRIVVIYKSKNKYNGRVIHSNKVASGSKQFGEIKKGSKNYYYDSSECNYGPQNNPQKFTTTCSQQFYVTNGNKITWTKTYPEEAKLPNPTLTNTLFRLWPENLTEHNAKFGGVDTNVEVKASSGTAFFVTDKGHLITNNHVIEGCKDKSKIVYKDKEYPAKLIAKDKLLDFALLKADISRNKFIVLSDDPPKKLQRIIAAGYPLVKTLSDDLKFTSGIISSLKGADDDSTLIQIDAALNKGNSGGPIVNEETGELVAVAVAGLRKDKTEAVNFGIKSNSLRNFLNANQMKLQSKQLFSFGKNIDVSQILEESTVYTFCK